MKLTDKNFNDFLATLTEEKMLEISSSAEKYTKENPLKPVDGVLNIGTSTAVISIKLSISLLETYHEWLLKDLD